MQDIAIKFENVNKEFDIYKTNSRRFLSLVLGIKTKHQVKPVLNNINFEIKKGENVALIGAIGSGRTVTTRMMASYMYPSSGKITVNGKIATLFDLKTGFVSNFSGRKNLKILANMHGWSAHKLAEHEQDIIDFAELGEIIDKPVKEYPKGASARLGFAFLTCEKPDVVIIDNNISVGSAEFKRKCIGKIEEYIADPEVTVILVAASVLLAKRLCNRGIVLDNCEVVLDDTIENALAYFEENIAPKSKRKAEKEDSDDEDDETENPEDNDDDYDDGY